MSSLIDQLPELRGSVEPDFPLSRITWFKVGGPAEILFKPADVEDLIHFLQNKPEDIPVAVIGVGSNLLVRDGGVDGVVIRLGREFTNVTIEDEEVIAEAGALCVNVARECQKGGMGALEFLVGIPGNVGGALAMNAGAYGKEIQDIFISAEAVDGQGNLHTVTKESMGFTYRHTAIPEDWIFLNARFKGEAQAPEKVKETMDKISAEREESQPIRTRTGGSTFKNPEGKKAWQLVDEAGCRGLQIGDAQVSEKHCNFLINTGEATAADLENLGEEVRRRVREKTGIELEWEIKRVGKHG